MRKSRGFTLIELLIVITIMGVLVSIGRVQYSRMVQKAKQGEAKSLLGGLASIERSFFGEYGTYGDQIRKMGFDASPLDYTIGFATVAAGVCADKGGVTLPGFSAAGVSNANRANLELRYSAYFTAPSETRIRPPNPAPSCASGKVWDIDLDPFSASGNTYRANASGLISPKQITLAPADVGAGGYDVWGLGSDGILSNDSSGID